MPLPTKTLRPIIAASAGLVSLPTWRVYPASVWLEGLILQESAGNPNARRYEGHQDTVARASREMDPDEPGLDDGELEDDASYGLMQVMGYNARVMVGAPAGTPMRFGFLLRPIANLAFGLRILLQELHATGGDVARALARYNGGPSGDDRDTPTSPMRRQIYVDGVYGWALRVAQDIRG